MMWQPAFYRAWADVTREAGPLEDEDYCEFMEQLEEYAAQSAAAKREELKRAEKESE